MPNELKLRVSGDSWNGAPRFTIAVDGIVSSTTVAVLPDHDTGTYEIVTWPLGDAFDPSQPHTIEVRFLNDAWGGTQDTDRNLYVDWVEVNGVRFEGENAASNTGGPMLATEAALWANGALAFNIPPSTSSEFDQHIVGTDSSETLVGGSGKDWIEGLGGNDVLRGEDGNDRLEGGALSDNLGGGAGNDTLLAGDGSDALGGGAGADVLDGGADFDIAFYDGSPVGVNVDLFAGTGSGGEAEGDTLTGIESVRGSQFADVLIAHSPVGGVFFEAFAGNDRLVGGDEDDTLTGGLGDDVLLGGGDDDHLMSGDRGPFHHNEDGFDTLDGGLGNDELEGGSNTTFIISEGNGNDRILGYQKGGRVVIDGYAVADEKTLLSDVTWGTGTATINLPNGETLNFTGSEFGGFADRTFFDNVTFEFRNATPTPTPTGDTLISVRVSADRWETGTAREGPQLGLYVDGQVVNIPPLTIITAEHSADSWETLTYNLGSDFDRSAPHTVEIKFDNDRYGGTPDKDDNLYIDWIELNGIRYEGEDASNNADLGLTDIDPNAAEMFVNGTLSFNIGPSTTPTPTPATITGSPTSDVLFGTQGDDVIAGNYGNDELHGLGGDDTLSGDMDDDTLDGGPGRDTFISRGGIEGTDTIIDFEAGAGGDRINLVNPMFRPDIEGIRASLQPFDGGFLYNVGHETHILIKGAGLTIDSFVAENFLYDGQPIPTPTPTPTPTSEATPTPNVPRSYVAADGSGAAQGTAAAEDIFATGNNQTLIGGGGHDIFHVGSHTGLTIDASGEGVSTVSTWAGTYRLNNGVDNLTANGDYSHSFVGNFLDNVVTGAGGADNLDGEDGDDILVGKGGADTFTYSQINNRGDDQDVILDFNRAEGDKIFFDYIMENVGQVSSFQRFMTSVEHGTFDVETGADHIKITFVEASEFSGTQSLTINGINNIVESDWMFASGF